ILFTAQEAVEWLARLYDEWGKPEEAAKCGKVKGGWELSSAGWALFHQQKYTEAERILNGAISFFDGPNGSEGEVRYYWEGLLGASLVAQKKYTIAEGRLLASYKGMTHPNAIDVGEPTLFTVQEAVEWLLRLYDEWGKAEEAAKWRKENG